MKQDFMNRFRFDPERALWLGVEREGFLCDGAGNIIPKAKLVLDQVGADSRFGYELSACQVETKIGPCLLDTLLVNLQSTDVDLATALVKADSALGLRMLYTEVGPADMPLDVYPDPTGRYQTITQNMPQHILSAACRVIGTHVHVGMPDHDTALRVYNRVIHQTSLLCEKGNGSFGERLAIYRVMAPSFEPVSYVDWESFYQAAVTGGFVDDPRRLWTLIRPSVHGTIEFRMFGATDSLERIVSWAILCHDLCAEAMS